MLAANGGQGDYSSGWLGYGSGRIREVFYEKAILVDRVLKKYNKSQLIAGIGIGSVNGRQLNDDESSLMDLEKTYGFAFKIAREKTGRIVGVSYQLFGNINKEVIFIGAAFNVTFGVWWN